MSEFLIKIFTNDKIAYKTYLKRARGYLYSLNQFVFENECVQIFLNDLRKTYNDDEDELFHSDLYAGNNYLRILKLKYNKN